MRRRSYILLASGFIALIGACLWFGLGAREPAYEGKPLNAWLRGVPGKSPAQADEAVRQIGPKGIPTLLRMLRERDSPLKTTLVTLAQSQRFVAVPHTEPAAQHQRAAHGFKCLGATAQDAAPALIAVFEADLSASSKWYAADSLGYIGPGARAAVPSLLRGVSNANERVRWSCVLALGEIQADPALVVPALTKCLRDPSRVVRANAVMALGAFGANARAAVPELIRVMDERQPGEGLLRPAEWGSPPERDRGKIRDAIWQALSRIDPEAAAKAGVKDPALENEIQ